MRFLPLKTLARKIPAMRFAAPYLLLSAALAPAVIAQVAPTAPAPKVVPGNFVDITQQSHIDFLGQASHTSKKYLIETMGSGVALFDYDNDGRLDIFFANGAPLSDPTPKGTIPQKTGPKYWNRLYHQKPDGPFEDVRRLASRESATTWA
jgi:hypothetical protein